MEPRFLAGCLGLVSYLGGHSSEFDLGANNSDPAATLHRDSISIGHHTEDTLANVNELISSSWWEKHQHRLRDGNTDVK
ncbi:unnamed protein product [Bubo scandiacus]